MEENWKLVTEINAPVRIIQCESGIIEFSIPDSEIKSAKGAVDSDSIVNYVLENCLKWKIP